MSTKIENNLGRNEHLVKDGKISWIVIVPHIILMVFAIGFVTIWRPLIAILTTRLCITNKKVVGKIGFIKVKTLDAPLNKINNVSVQQGLFGRIFGYGTIRIDTSSGFYKFDFIKQPNEFKATLLNQIEIYDDERIKRQAQITIDANRIDYFI